MIIFSAEKLSVETYRLAYATAVNALLDVEHLVAVAVGGINLMMELSALERTPSALAYDVALLQSPFRLANDNEIGLVAHSYVAPATDAEERCRVMAHQPCCLNGSLLAVVVAECRHEVEHRYERELKHRHSAHRLGASSLLLA